MHYFPALIGIICLMTISLPGLTHPHPTTADGAKSSNSQITKTTADETTCTPNPLKQAFFGETHLHTGLSFDASQRLVPTTPREAYAFAKGGVGIRRVGKIGHIYMGEAIDRPLDWGAVTDHAEYFGEMGLCKYDQFGSNNKPEPDGLHSLDCRLLTGFYWQVPETKKDFKSGPRLPPEIIRQLSDSAFDVVTMPSIGPSSRNVNLPLCESGQASCDLSLWQEMQAAAEEANEPCTFTSFVGYEVTSTPGGTNWHRNVIFANDQVIDEPITAIDMAREPNPDPDNDPPQWFGAPDVTKLWDGLQSKCIDGKPGCDVLTIPHNSNLGGGLRIGKTLIPPMFFDPADTRQAQQRQRFEPLVEIYQAKGSSECRWDPRHRQGVNTSDEFCDFELLDISGFAPTGSNAGAPPVESFHPRSYVRNVLKDGLKFEQNLGVNPFKLGIIAASDSHNGDMGWQVEDERYTGHAGIKDVLPVRSANIQDSSGGLSVVWAEQNTRESIFAALKRRETYGTSGTRIQVRLFGGWDFSAASCGQGARLVRTGYRKGVPMGQDLPSKASDAPQFIVQAQMDDFIGTPLDRIQIIKGWVDEDGETHEKVFHVTGDTDTATETVDPQTCKSPEPGHRNLCQIFTDPEFDPAKPAFYYARVLEKPVCRHSTHYCRVKFNVDPLSPNCKNQLAVLKNPVKAANARACCSNETTNLIVQPVIQERAWTSPIWYKPSPL